MSRKSKVIGMERKSRCEEGTSQVQNKSKRRVNLTFFEVDFSRQNMVFENHRKSLIQHCELRLHLEWTKVTLKCQKWSILASFLKPEACGQKVLPDKSVLIGQKLVENAKIQKFKCDILSNFQTICMQ